LRGIAARPCGRNWRKEARQVTDRALRYRANACPPPGSKICVLCGAARTVEVGHVDGHEENTAARVDLQELQCLLRERSPARGHRKEDAQSSLDSKGRRGRQSIRHLHGSSLRANTILDSDRKKYPDKTPYLDGGLTSPPVAPSVGRGRARTEPRQPYRRWRCESAAVSSRTAPSVEQKISE
jgi:hypothetical protein